MTHEEVPAERFAELFHHYHQTLAPDFGDNDRRALEMWNELEPLERARMVTAARLALIELDSKGENDDRKRYFAKPGEAEWGC